MNLATVINVKRMNCFQFSVQTCVSNEEKKTDLTETDIELIIWDIANSNSGFNWWRLWYISRCIYVVTSSLLSRCINIFRNLILNDDTLYLQAYLAHFLWKCTGMDAIISSQTNVWINDVICGFHRNILWTYIIDTGILIHITNSLD